MAKRKDSPGRATLSERDSPKKTVPLETLSRSEMRKALAEETGLSEDELKDLARGFLD